MSEYQYYEFLAVDGPISDEGLRYAESCSSRADVSRLHWRNVYNYGDFRGDVERLLQYYDAHFYIANWGSVRFAISFPQGLLPLEVIAPYATEQNDDERSLTITSKGTRDMVSWERHEEGGWGWTEGEGILSRLIGVRDELICGDYRSLFLGWLSSINPNEFKQDLNKKNTSSFIPADLDKLTFAQKELMELFAVDPDALAVAARESNMHRPARIPIEAVIDGLSVSKMKDMLARVANGGSKAVIAELQRATYP